MADDDDGPSIPGWIFDLRALVPFIGLITAFARSPREFILERVLGWVVERILAGVAFMVGVIEEVGSTIASIPSTLWSPISGAGAVLTEAVSGALLLINDAIVSVVSVTGPAAPLVVAIVWAVIAIGVTRIGIKPVLTAIKWIT